MTASGSHRSSEENNMKKRELIEAVAGHTGVDKKTAGAIVEGTIDVILSTVAKGEQVALAGFAKFEKRKRPARMGRNPATGAPVKIAAKTVAKITALKGFKDIALGNVAAPKLNKAAPVAAKAPAKKAAPAKKTAAKKAAPAKKAAAKKAPAKKAPAKKVVKKAAKKK
jgi:DNA-binding protein HU-beta